MEHSSVILILFFIVTCWLVYISRKSLRDPSSHGFYRFFAWEAILVLLLINIPDWFSNPFSAPHILSWIALLGSVVVLVWGIRNLRSAGNSADRRLDETLYAFEKTTTLVTSGIYHYIRHPLYASLMYLAWGTFLKDIGWASLCLVMVATTGLIITAKKDEAECIRFFGPIYRDYMARSKMFIPYLF